MPLLALFTTRWHFAHFYTHVGALAAGFLDHASHHPKHARQRFALALVERLVRELLVLGHLGAELLRRPFLVWDLALPTQKIGTFDTELVREFFQAFSTHGGITLHIHQLEGINSHHIVEAAFKAVARALRDALETDPRKADAIPSTKGSL